MTATIDNGDQCMPWGRISWAARHAWLRLRRRYSMQKEDVLCFFILYFSLTMPLSYISPTHPDMSLSLPQRNCPEESSGWSELMWCRAGGSACWHSLTSSSQDQNEIDKVLGFALIKLCKQTKKWLCIGKTTFTKLRHSMHLTSLGSTSGWIKTVSLAFSSL